MTGLDQILLRPLTRIARRHLVGPRQSWVFEHTPVGWTPGHVECSSFYIHIPFCRHFCPYCPYTKIAYDPALTGDFTLAAIREIDWWADHAGPTRLSSVYIGGGTPTLALDSLAAILEHLKKRFILEGDICIETNPADVDENVVKMMQDMGIRLVSLGVQSFQKDHLKLLGRGYAPEIAESALALLAGSGFASVNADFMFALPEQDTSSLLTDLDRAADLGADQITTYPLFTFPYTTVGKYLKIRSVRMPNLRTRLRQYRAISEWCARNGFERVSVWGFKRGGVPRYSSVTRDGYIGIGPGSGSHLPHGFVLNTFDFRTWQETVSSGKSAAALQLGFTEELSAWWWLYWRFYDTHIPLEGFENVMGKETRKARFWLAAAARLGLTCEQHRVIDLNEAGAFWLHLGQNYFALNYVNKLWTEARRTPWPKAIAI